MTTLARLIATWFGCGHAPVGPGTIGSLAALGIAYALHWTVGMGTGSFALLALLLAPVGVWAADVTAHAAGRKDPGLVVVDEVVGQWLTLAGATQLTPLAWLLAFGLFRLFDIVKPFPARRLESLPGGLGIVADDAMAGAYGALALWMLGRAHLY